MFSWFKARKERAQDKAEERKIQISVAKHEATTALKQAENIMFSQLCPIQKGYCNRKCVHFKQGKIYYWFAGFIKEEAVSDIDPPTCRLWK